MPDQIYTLPELAYDYSALEPHISGRIMELHHDKHHATYVKGANTALEKLDSARRSGKFATISMLEKSLAFNISGHVLHSIFWTNLGPQPSEPTGALADALGDAFDGVLLASLVDEPGIDPTVALQRACEAGARCASSFEVWPER